MFDPERLLANMVGDALGGAFGGKRGKKSMFRTGNLGGKAALGLGALGVAMAAFEHFQQTRPASGPSTPPAPTLPPAPASSSLPAAGVGPSAPPPPPPAPKLDALDARSAEAVLLVQTMIAAAAADAEIDAEERGRILARAAEAGLDADTRRFLEAELAVPKSIDALVARTRPDQVNEVYAAALLAIRLDTEAERRFLKDLAERLGMSEDLRAGIHEALLT